MIRLQVDRVQHPIGQGGFHSVALHSSHWHGFSMVVDCGGSNLAHRETLAKAFAEGRREHDFLAISHLDDDHINGLEELRKAGIVFRTVFLPHVDLSRYLKWMTLRICANSTCENDISAEDQAAETISSFSHSSMGLYSGRYGEVVRVTPPNRDGSDRDPSGRDADTAVDLDRHRGPLTKQSHHAISKGAQSGGGLSSSTSLTFELDWLIRFYSREWSCPKEVSGIWKIPALQGLRRVIDSIDSDFGHAEWAAFSSSLRDELKKKVDNTLWKSATSPVGKASDLAKLSTEISNGEVSCKELLSRLYKLSGSLQDYNDASMCVYSGPADRGVAAPRKHFIRLQDVPTLKSLPRHDNPNRRVGWMHTGDAAFKTKAKLEAFIQHYFGELPLTSVMVLPHHGSRMSFDAEMNYLHQLSACLARPTAFIAPANPGGPYHHPHPEVENVCKLLGELLIVDDRAASQYSDTAITPTPWCTL